MSLCDVVCLTSDGLLGFDHLGFYGDRIPYIQNLIIGLIEVLRSTTNGIIKRASTHPAWFAIAPSKLFPPNNKIRDLITYQADIIREPSPLLRTYRNGAS